MLVCDIVNAHPAAKDVLLSFGLPCFRCEVAWHETLAEGLKPHAIEPSVVLEKLDLEAPMKNKPAKPPKA